MSKCGKSFMPECEYFTTGGCVSPFNCPYKMENKSITTATSTPLNPNVIYTTETDKDKEIARLTAENERLSKQLTDSKCVYLSDSETAEGCVQSPCPNYKTVEDILKENASLRARLEKAVKIGDTVYQTDTDGARIYKSTVKRIIFDTGDFAFDETAIGTSVFLSEEALIKKQSKEKTEK